MNEQTKKKVYVIEDDRNIRVVIELVAKSLHHEVRAFASGTDGLEAIRSTCPDLILTDYRMPGMNGVELVRAVRETVSQTVPIILISGSIAVLGRLQDSLSDLDSIEYVSKPFSPRLVAAHIQRMLNTYAHSAAGEENG